MQRSEFEAGSNQVIVVYAPDDTGNEIDPAEVYAEVAVDADARSAAGWRIVSTAALPTRHSAAFLGREGSGYETKAAVVVVYARP